MVPLRVSVVESAANKPFVDGAWIAAQVAEANRAFRPAGIEFVVVEEASHSGPAHLETREDRTALAAFAERGVVNWFVAASLRDVDEPGRMRRGVHWYGARDGAPVHFVIVSAAAKERVLAHELGHFFGNHKHSEVLGNVMSYAQDERPPTFDDAQLKRIRRSFAAFRRSGELRTKRQTASAPGTSPAAPTGSRAPGSPAPTATRR